MFYKTAKKVRLLRVSHRDILMTFFSKTLAALLPNNNLLIIIPLPIHEHDFVMIDTDPILFLSYLLYMDGAQST